jgi:hypothetical protein
MDRRKSPWLIGRLLGLAALGLAAVGGVQVAADEPRAPAAQGAEEAVKKDQPEATPKPRPDAPLEIRGRVVDAGTGKPIDRFVEQSGRVDPKDPNKVTWGFSEGRTESANPEGRFHTNFSGYPEYRLRILADGYLPQPVEPPQGQGGKVELTVRMRRGRQVVGRVVDGAGKAVVDAAVFLVGSRQVNLTGGKAVRAFVGGEDRTVTRAVTDAEGRFTLTGAGGDDDRVAVSAPTLDLHVVPAPPEGQELTVVLPEPGRLTLRYDIEGGEPEASFILQLHIEEKGWQRVDNLREPTAPNGGRTVLTNVTPGTYALSRFQQLRIGDMGRGVLCDRREVTVASGQAAEANFVRDRGGAISGQVVGLDPDKGPGALLSVWPAEATGNPFAREVLTMPTFDATTCGKDGRFRTERLLPGSYTVVAEAYIPAPKGGPFTTGIRLPDFLGVVKVTVPEQGPPPPVRIEMRPTPGPPPEKP